MRSDPMFGLRSLFGSRCRVVVGAAGLLFGSVLAPAGEVSLKNGLVIGGNPRRLQSLTLDNVRTRDNETPNFPFLMIENGYQRIFVPQRQMQETVERDDLSKFETFTIRQRKTALKRMPGSLGTLGDTTPFNAFGQRSHTVRTESGPREIIVGVTKITPQYVSITGLNHQWDHGVATLAIPPEQLDAMIRTSSDSKNPDHRFSIARFYLQAGLYEESGRELDSIAKDFPELVQRVAEARKELIDFEQKLIVQELKRRKANGQYELAYHSARQVPQGEASAAVLRDVREIIRDYESAHERIKKARTRLAELQSGLADRALAASVASLRPLLEAQINVESLDRLQAFFNLADDPTLGPPEKLALAYSGWVVGSSAAVTDLHLAVRLWEAQRAILDYLRAETPQDRREPLKAILSLDAVGPETVVKLIRHLPPLVETPDIRPGVATSVSISGRNADAPPYWVLLPPEYDWRHSYPMIVALHPIDRSAKSELGWWGGTLEKPGLAQRRGYIVISPEYADANARQYNYSIAAHEAVLGAITDARRRYRVDSDRIFLGGHGMGADAAFDMGMSHPDEFAGVMPIAGVCDQFCRWYWQNAGYTAWYVVTGELDRDTFSTNAITLMRMMRPGMDVVLVEFIQRGYESYIEESPRLFDWMELHRRQKPPREIEMRVLRATENQLFWLRADGLPASVLRPTVLAGESRGSIHPMLLGGKITAGNSIFLRSPARSHTLWLTPELLNPEQRIAIRLRGSQKYHGIPKQTVEAALEDFRLRADRERVCTMRIDLN